MLREQPVEIRATAASSISRHTKLACHTDLGAFQQYNDTGNSEGTFPMCSLLTTLCICWRQTLVSSQLPGEEAKGNVAPAVPPSGC